MYIIPYVKFRNTKKLPYIVYTLCDNTINISM